VTRATYRHGKPPSRLARKIDRMLEGVAPARLFVMAWGVASIGLTVLALVGFGFFKSDSGSTAKAHRPAATKVALSASAAPSAATVDSAEGADPDVDPGALAFLKAKDPGSADLKHLKDVKWSGDFVRVYTDLKEEDTDSPAALKFCQWTVEYLEQNFKDQKPVVFVHAKKSDNGYVVLVNNAGAKKCRSVETR
jgi:hypothetical protein